MAKRYPGTLMMQPNLFVVGAMKAATTSIAQYLAELDAVAMCDQKEPNHFCVDLFEHPEFESMPLIRAFAGQDWVRDRETYLSMFHPTAATRYVAEASTTYLYSTQAAAEIARFNPEARIVILLRHPVKRAYSEYLMNQMIGLARRSFAEEMAADEARGKKGEFKLFERYVYASLYAEQVKRFVDAFPRERIFVAAMDEPGLGMDRLASRLCAFLGIDQSRAVPRSNEAGSAAFPALNHLLFRTGIKGWVSRAFPDAIKDQFKRIYYEKTPPDGIPAAEASRWMPMFHKDVAELEALLGMNFGFWR